MTFNPHNYETVYGFEFLDGLHNFFPEFLYDDQMFESSVPMMYFQHRMSTLFSTPYVRQQNMYRLYNASRYRAYFNNFNNRDVTHVIAAATVTLEPTTVHTTTPAAASPARGTSPTTLPATPVAQPTRRGVTGAPRRARTGAGSRISNFLDITGLNTIPNERLHVSPFYANNETQNTMDDLLASILTGVAEAGLPGMMGMAGRNHLWEDVEVAPTHEQVNANSVILTHNTVNNDEVCAVCQEHGSEQSWRRLTPCAHTFHLACIDRWFLTNVHCPVCRADIRGPYQ